jgi:hypothetical protein
MTVLPINWVSAVEAGLDHEPPDAVTAEVGIDADLLIHLNAVVYQDGSWKITEYDKKELDLIDGGKEPSEIEARDLVEQKLYDIFLDLEGKSA